MNPVPKVAAILVALLFPLWAGQAAAQALSGAAPTAAVVPADGIVTLERAGDELFRVELDGRPIGQLDWRYAEIVERFPDPVTGHLTLIAVHSGGNGDYPENGGCYIVDSRRAEPLVDHKIDACSRSTNNVATESRLVIGGSDRWTNPVTIYDGQSVTTLGTLALSEHVERAIDAIGRKDYTTALAHLLASQDHEDARADFWLGRLFHHGWGVRPDLEKARALYERAAEAGNAAAMFRLGTLYANGRSVPKDDARAVAYYREAAERGDTSGQFNLALALMTGRGTGEDEAEALRWFLIARPSLTEPGDIAAAGKNIAALASELDAERAAEITQAAAAYVPARPRAWSFPADWDEFVGKYLFERARGVTLLGLPDLRSRLRTLVTDEDLFLIENMTTGTPIRREGDWIVASGCRPHDCTNNYTLAINQSTLEPILCIRQDLWQQHRTLLRWYRPGHEPILKDMPFDLDLTCSYTEDPVAELLAATSSESSSAETPLPATAPPPQPTPWYTADFQFMECIESPSSPATAIEVIRRSGMAPTVREERDLYGDILSVEVAAAAGLQETYWTYYRTKAACERKITADNYIPNEYR